MSGDRPKVLWDSCVCIDFLGGNARFPARAEHARLLFREHFEERLLVMCSAMAAMEVRHVEGAPDPEESERRIVDFFRDVEPVAFDQSTARDARLLLRDHPGKLQQRDAVHVATALATRCEFLLTNDGDGNMGQKRKERPLLPLSGLLGGDPVLQIVTPEAYWNERHSKDLIFPDGET